MKPEDDWGPADYFAKALGTAGVIAFAVVGLLLLLAWINNYLIPAL